VTAIYTRVSSAAQREEGTVASQLDGMEIAERTHVVALGITTEGVKIPLGLWEGSTENATLARRCWPIWSTAALTPSRRSCS
jgi:hypothetical protein